MKPVNIKTTRQKEVRRLRKRQCEIRTLNRDLDYIELDKPIRHGWYKEIIITEKADRYKNKAAILEIYDKIERYYWGRTKEEAEKKWLDQTSKHLIYKDFPTISKKQFNKLSFKAQCLCTAFQFRNNFKKLKIRFYVRIPKGAYRIKHARAYITHRKRIDPLLESEWDLITQQLEKPEYYTIAESCYKYKDNWHLSEYKQEKLQTNKHLKALKKHKLKDVINDTILWERN